MPYKKNYKKTAKRNFRKKTMYRKPSSGLAKSSLALFPASKIVKLRYSDQIEIAGGVSGAINSYQFITNGLYDTDYTGTGHQPLGFDQLLGTSGITGFYNTYEVIGYKLVFKFASVIAGGNPISVCIRQSTKDEASSFTEMRQLSENRANVKIISSNDTSSKMLTVKGAPRKMFGVNSNDVVLTGTYATNPSLNTWATIYVQDLNGTETTNGIEGIVTIDYIVKLSNPKMVFSS